MPSEDLKTYATSDTDFYELLGITFETSQRDIDRAWRKTALKYHPDKVGTDPVAKEKFHLAQIGYDLLSDPTIKLLYDNTRTARLQRKRQNEAFEGRRRQMKDDLEARERGVKRERDDEEGDEEKLEREIRRLAEDGRRRRKEREEGLKKDLLREAEQPTSTAAGDSMAPSMNPAATAIPCTISELDRTVKVRWPQEADAEALKAQDIKSLFSVFGSIESADILTPKMLRIGKKHKKQLVATCMIQYSSVVGAHAAVEDFKKKTGPEWSRFDSVFWAANKEPDFIRTDGQPLVNSSTPSTPPTRYSFSASPKVFPAGLHSTPPPSTTTRLSPGAGQDGEGNNFPKKKPSFASFPSAIFNTPNGSPSSFGKNTSGVYSPSLEEMTMIRLKNAEKKRLADEIRRQDEEAANNAAAAAASAASVAVQK
jgi:DnaJ family protein C protein 17